MREIGIVTLLSVAVTAAAPHSSARAPAMFVTRQSTAAFVNCFARSEERRGQAWWFVPSDHGGALSNLGNRSGAAIYFIKIEDRRESREITLDQQGAGNGTREAVDECI